MITIPKKTTSFFLKYFFLLTCVVGYLFPIITLSCNLSESQKIEKFLQHIQKKEHIADHQKTILNNLQYVLQIVSTKKNSNTRIKEHQKIIENFLCLAPQSHEKYYNISNENINNVNENFSDCKLKQKPFQINSQKINLSEQLKQKINHMHFMNESLILLPQQQIITNTILNNLESQQILSTNINNPIKQSKFTMLQMEQLSKQLTINKLNFFQLNTKNNQELLSFHITLPNKQYNHVNNELEISKYKLNQLSQKKTTQNYGCNEKILIEKNNILPKSITKQLQTNHDLAIVLTQQTNYMHNISLKKKEILLYISQVRQVLSNLLEQTQWLDKSPALGEALRSQVSKLPRMPKSQQLDHDMSQLRTKRLQYENLLNKSILLLSQSKQDDGTPLTLSQKNILEIQLTKQRNLITSLLNSYNIQILELTKLKVAYEQLKKALQEVREATYRHLFWVADIPPITLSYPLDIYQDLHRLLVQNEFNHQILSALKMIFTDQKIRILVILCMMTSIGLHFGMYLHYKRFLEQSSKKIGKVNQDNFLLTFHNIWSSMLIALPIPMLWAMIGYSLSNAWLYPIFIAISDGINSTIFILWIFIINAYFASPKGLFIVHFGWSKKRVKKVFSHYYILAVGTIIFLIMMVTTFNNYNDKELYNTLGRLCFILLCIHLTFITKNLKCSGLPLYLNKYDSSGNIINRSLWNIMICAPIIAAIFSTLGYLFTAQKLLERLEISLFIWITLLIVYHIIRRWIFIQRRLIDLERAKQKRAAQLILKNYDKSNSPQSQNTPIHDKLELYDDENNKKILNLDTISAQSLQLIRSIITIIALLLITLLWSELYSAFSFLENITLWDVTSTIKGIDNIQPITLNSFLIAVLVIVITTKIVRNLPAFLELTFLQHLDLTPGTGYAITTLTKYILMFFGGIIGCSLIGIEWTKIQWLIAALGVGLGFGLQEIFANFISGLMILFEKPIRIGDTVTISNLTGNITRINTRATIITDWNHKEIIVPNKEFITKQFINWSLSNTLVRVVLRVPAPLQTDANKIMNVLLKIVKNSPFTLSNPAPEVYLVDLQQGFPIFEIRIHISDIKLRMPLCHQIHMLIIEYYQNNKLKLPYLPAYLCNNQLFIKNFDLGETNTNYYTTK